MIYFRKETKKILSGPVNVRVPQTMTDNLNIINSKLVNSSFDAFWNEDAATADKTADTLIICTPYAPGGSEEQQLLKMLQACSLKPEDYVIVQLAEGQELSWHIIRDKVKATNIITLGITTQQLGISAMFRFNEPNRFNGCMFIPTLSLPELEKQTEVKKQLWLSSLKPVFVDKVFQNPR